MSSLPNVDLNQADQKPAPSSFVAGLRSMIDEARSAVAQARVDGTAEVRAAVTEMHNAKDATKRVAGNMAKTIKDEAASVLAELGQISNDLG